MSPPHSQTFFKNLSYEEKNDEDFQEHFDCDPGDLVPRSGGQNASAGGFNFGGGGNGGGKRWQRQGGNKGSFKSQLSAATTAAHNHHQGTTITAMHKHCTTVTITITTTSVLHRTGAARLQPVLPSAVSLLLRLPRRHVVLDQQAGLRR